MTTPKPRYWICPMCGYIHEGEQPPDECPVCGAEGALFEPYQPPEAATPRRWRCPDCGYIHEGETPPEECPQCGAPGASFELLPEEEAVVLKSENSQKIVVLGGGVAGVSAVEAARKAAPDAKITLFCNESGLPYYRLNLTRYMVGEVEAAALALHPLEWYAENGIDLDYGEAVSLDPAGKSVTLADGRIMVFDRLVLAVGAAPFVPPIPGAKLNGVYTLRTQQDAERLLSLAGAGKRCVVIGGGLLGLEAAAALAKRGMAVTVIESMTWLLPRQLNESASRLLKKHVEKLGISVRVNSKTRELAGDGAVDEVVLEDGTRLPADMVLISAGVRSRLDLARQAGLEVKFGVVVDDHLQTSMPDIFAAGDVAEHRGVVYGTWGPAQAQGSVAGANAAGETKVFLGLPRSNTLKVLGMPLFSGGQNVPPAEGDCVLEFDEAGRYAWFLFKGNVLSGAILLGDTSLMNAVKKAIAETVDCSELLNSKTRLVDVERFFNAHE